MADAARKLDEHLAAVVIGAQRPPWRAIAGDLVAEVDAREIDARRDGTRRLSLRVLPPKRDELILLRLPGDERHVGALRRTQLHVISAQVRVDDEVRHQLRPSRLDQNMHLRRRARTALRVADDPAHRVACRDRFRADELLAGLKRNVGDLTHGRIDLVERALRVGIDLDRIDEAVAHGLDPRRRVGLVDASGGIGGLRRATRRFDRLQLARQRQGTRQFDDPYRRGGLRLQRRRRGVVIRDFRRRLRRRATSKRAR